MDQLITQLLLTYQLPAIFFGAFFFGETVIITAAFLAGQGIWSVFNVFWLALLGTVLADSLWFIFGQSFFKLTQRYDKYKTKSEKVLSKLETITGERPFLALLFIKFLYGTRVLTIMYLSIRKISFLTFILFDTIGTFIWLTVMILIGWLAGRGITNYIQTVDRIEYTLLAIALIIILLRIFTLWLKKKIIKE